MTNLYYIGKIKGLSEINLPMKNEFGCQTSVLGEVHLLIKPQQLSGAAAVARVQGLTCLGGISARGEAALGRTRDSPSGLGGHCGARSSLPLCEEKTNIVLSCYFSSLIKLWLAMTALCIFQSQKGGSCSFHRLLDFLSIFFQLLTEKKRETPHMSCSNRMTAMCTEEITAEHEVRLKGLWFFFFCS